MVPRFAFGPDLAEGSALHRRVPESRATTTGLSARQFGFHAADLVVHCLRLVRSRSHLEHGEDSRSAHLMNGFVASLNGGEYLVPFTFDVCAIGVQYRLQPGFPQHSLTGRYVSG